MSAIALMSSSGRVALGNQLGRGGEGAVYDVVGRADLVAKVYHSPASSEKARKLQAMAKLATAELLALTAWPIDVLLGKDGGIRGVLMPKVDGYKDIHALYGPKSRRAEFPAVTWKHLIRAATNVARSFAVLHENRCVVGDVNHGGIRVRADMTVKLIDCDSFQLHTDGHVFYCEVGVENFTPPELQGRSFKGILRTPNHDNFGLAVMVFYLLMLGRHPFAGRYSGRGEMPIEKAIAEHRYAYGRNAKSILMDPPPFAPAALSASADIAELWERAFSPQVSHGATRPTAREWVGRLKELENSAKRCTQHPGHYFVSALAQCPWCAIESASGALLFLAPMGTIVTDHNFNLALVWSRIAQIVPPGPAPRIPMLAATPSPQATDLRRACTAKKVGGRIAVLTAAVIALVLAPAGFIAWVVGGLALWAATGAWAKADADLTRFREKFAEAEKPIKDIQQKLNADAGPGRFSQRLKELEVVRAEYANLPIIRDRKMKALIADREQHARRRFLERFEIENAKISGIGPAKRAMLESYNIETAADITESAVTNVPGFGPALYSRLASWRHSVEIRFRFDPASAVDARDVHDLERSIAQRRAQIERSLLQGVQELERLRQESTNLRAHLLTAAAPYADAYAQAEADWNFLKS